LLVIVKLAVCYTGAQATPIRIQDISILIASYMADKFMTGIQSTVGSEASDILFRAVDVVVESAVPNALQLHIISEVHNVYL
jgi:predicted nucleotidyltransferase